jgi:hypothetical protein
MRESTRVQLDVLTVRALDGMDRFTDGKDSAIPPLEGDAKSNEVTNYEVASTAG